MELLLAMVFFGLCMAGLGVGLIVQGKELQKSCGGVAETLGGGDCACARKEAELCGDPLVELAQIAHPNPHKHA